MESFVYNILEFLTKPLLSFYGWVWGIVIPWVQQPSPWRQNRTEFISKFPEVVIMGTYVSAGSKAYYLDSYIANTIHGKPTDNVSVTYATTYSGYWKPVDVLVLHETGSIVRHRQIMERLSKNGFLGPIVKFGQKYQLIQPGYPLSSRQSRGFKDINFSSSGRLFVSRIDPETQNGEIYEIKPPESEPEIVGSILNCKAVKWLDIPSNISWQGYFSFSDDDVLHISVNRPRESGEIRKTNAIVGQSVQSLSSISIYKEPNRSILGFDLNGPSQIYYTSNVNLLTVADIKNNTQNDYMHFSSLNSSVMLDYSVRKLNFNKVVLTSSGVELDPFLRLNPKIRSHMVWWFIDETKKDAEGEWLPYDKWPAHGKEKLFNAYNKIRNNQNPDFPEISKDISEEGASNIYYAYTAFSLWVEINNKVNWSLLDLKGSEISNDDCLYMMLDGRHMFIDIINNGNNEFIYGHHYNKAYYSPRKTDHKMDVFPAQPRFVFNFLAQNNLIRHSIRDTVKEILRWYEINLSHRSGCPWVNQPKEFFEKHGVENLSEFIKEKLGVNSVYETPIEWVLTKRKYETAELDSKGEFYAWHGCHSAASLTYVFLHVLNVPSEVWSAIVSPGDCGKVDGTCTNYGHEGIKIPTEDLISEHMDHFYANLHFLHDPTFDLFKIFMTRTQAKNFYKQMITDGDQDYDIEQALFRRLALLALQHPTALVVIRAWVAYNNATRLSMAAGRTISTEELTTAIYKELRRALGTSTEDKLYQETNIRPTRIPQDLFKELDKYKPADGRKDLPSDSLVRKFLNDFNKAVYNTATIMSKVVKDENGKDTIAWIVATEDESTNTSHKYYLRKFSHIGQVWIKIHTVQYVEYTYYRVNEPTSEPETHLAKDYISKKHAIKKSELLKISRDLVTHIQNNEQMGLKIEDFEAKYDQWSGGKYSWG